MRFFLGFIVLISLASCQNSKELSTVEKDGYLKIGDSISNHVQSVLLTNVTQKMQQDGGVEAVAFCSEKAIILTDSVAAKYNVKVSRLTDKNRNPNNGLQSATDRKAWEEFQLDGENNQLIYQEKGSIVYYKTIPLGMSACLKCHGNKTSDISVETLQSIQINYPQDLATGYTVGDLRGMWKIELN